MGAWRSFPARGIGDSARVKKIPPAHFQHIAWASPEAENVAAAGLSELSIRVRRA